MEQLEVSTEGVLPDFEGQDCQGEVEEAGGGEGGGRAQEESQSDAELGGQSLSVAVDVVNGLQ